MRLPSRHALLPNRQAARTSSPTAPTVRVPASGADLTALDALGCVVAAYGPERLLGRGNARASDRALRSAARRLAAEARAQDPARAERLLVQLKGAWPALPAVRAVTDLRERRALWDRVVGLCVEEFYSPPAGSAAS